MAGYAGDIIMYRVAAAYCDMMADAFAGTGPAGEEF